MRLLFHGFQFDHSTIIQLAISSSVLTLFRWSYGANRVQLEADIKVLNDFLTLLQTDSVRASHQISSTSFPMKTGVRGE